MTTRSRRHQRPGARTPRRRRHSEQGRAAPGLVDGVVRLEGDGSARLVPQDPRRMPIYLPPSEARQLRSGDVVTVRIDVGRKGRLRGALVKKGPAGEGKLVGVVRSGPSGPLLAPEPFGPPLALEPSEASVGDAVEVQLTRAADRHRPGRARVLAVLGRADAPPVQVEMLIRQQGLPMQFSEAALAQATSAPAPRSDRALADGQRHDLRQVPHVTIDGEDARDFDDAVAARDEGGLVRVWVSIADVSHYVVDDSPLDRDARQRGTSVYFPGRVIPMLPERLSNDLCSLRPGAPRLTLTAELAVRTDGRVERPRIYPSLIESRCRLTYEQVQALYDGGPVPPEVQAQRQSLEQLLRASRAVRAARRKRGSIDLELPEPYVIVDAGGTARHIRQRPRLEAHRVIEDLMIAANEAVAAWLSRSRWPTVYRVHEDPSPERIEALGRWGKKLGLDVDRHRLDRPSTLARLADTLKKLPQALVGQTLLLRSLAQARYSDQNLGHFGLASRGYLHFTSPIRRYPDLLVHRSLRRLWQKQGPLTGLADLAERASVQERRAMEAERAVVELMACHVAAAHLGEELVGTVSGVHRAGAFVRTAEPLLDGLIPIGVLSARGGEYFDLIEDEQLLLARRSGYRLQIGDPVRVRIARVEPRSRRIEFEPVDVRALARRAPRPDEGRKRPWRRRPH